MILTVLGFLLLTLLVIVTGAIVRTANLFAAVVLLSLFSLLMAANFFLLDAADVALTEAAVGAGISTVLMLAALALTAETEKTASRLKWVAAGTVTALTLVLLYATLSIPRMGDPSAPVHQHVAPWYLQNTPHLIDIPNVVSAILASFRGYDTLGEVFVVFTAGIGVLFMLGMRRFPAGKRRIPPPQTLGLKHHLVPRTVGTFILPFIILFGLYVQFHGEHGPGGGFQAGAIMAAAFILYALLEGERRALDIVPPRVLMLLLASGAFLYGAVGVMCMLLGGNFLDYNVLAADPVAGQHLGIMLVELGVGVSVTGVLLSIYHAFAKREPA